MSTGNARRTSSECANIPSACREANQRERQAIVDELRERLADSVSSRTKGLMLSPLLVLNNARASHAQKMHVLVVTPTSAQPTAVTGTTDTGLAAFLFCNYIGPSQLLHVDAMRSSSDLNLKVTKCLGSEIQCICTRPRLSQLYEAVKQRYGQAHQVRKTGNSMTFISAGYPT